MKMPARGGHRQYWSVLEWGGNLGYSNQRRKREVLIFTGLRTCAQMLGVARYAQTVCIVCSMWNGVPI